MTDKTHVTVDPVRRAALFGGLSLGLAPLAGAAAARAQEVPGSRRAVGLADAAANGVIDDSKAVLSAFARHDTINTGSFTVAIDEGTYLLSGSGRSLVHIQPGLRVLGASLEGTQFLVARDATATAVFSDDSERGEGSAAKIELYNLTANGAGNRHLNAVFDLGTGGSTQFGTYGRLDNLMARDAPRATAFNLSANIVAVGDLYSMNTRDGLVSNDGGSGCNVRSMYPYGWSRYGTYLGGIGDSVLAGEGEAPTSEDAVYGYGSRSFIYGLGSHIISVAQKTTLKRPWVINTGIVGDWALGPWCFIRNHATQRFGDFANVPAGFAGTATAIGGNTLTDSTKSWELDQLKGWAIKILTGPGAANWAEIASNTSDTITLSTSSWAATGLETFTDATTPTTNSTYAVAPALCKADPAQAPSIGARGLASSKVMTLAEAVIRSLFARALRVHDMLANAVTIGTTANAAKLRVVAKGAASLKPGTIAAKGAVSLVIKMEGIDLSRDQTVSIDIPAAFHSPGVTWNWFRRPDLGGVVLVGQNFTAANIVVNSGSAATVRALLFDYD